jgi:hypothetical protein
MEDHMRPLAPPLASHLLHALRDLIDREGLRRAAELCGVDIGTAARLAAGAGAYRATRAAIERALSATP